MNLRTSQSAPMKNSSIKGIQKLMCPYKTAESVFCSASVMTVALDTRRKALYCCTEDYDRCPLFLAKMLRGQNTKGDPHESGYTGARQPIS